MNFISLYNTAFVFILLTTSTGFSQPQELLEKYNNLHGEEKILAGLAMVEKLADSPDKMVAFAKILLVDTEKTHKNRLLHAKVLKALSDGYFYADSIEFSNKYLNQAIQIAEKLPTIDTLFIGTGYNDLGMNYQEAGQNEAAKEFLLKAVAVLKNPNHAESLADAKSNLATLYHSEGNYEQAIQLFQEVYELDVKTGNKSRQSSSLNGLGRMYVDWGKYDTGLEFYFRSIDLLDTINERKTLAIRYNNIGMVYQLMQKHHDAIEWISKAKKIEEQAGEKQKVGIRSFNLATSYAALKDFARAKQYYLEAEAIFGGTSLYAQLSKINAGLGQLFFVNGQNNLAFERYTKALEYAESAGNLPEKSNIYQLLYQYHKKKNQYDKALTYYELHNQLKDSVFNLKVSEQMEQMQAQYQTAQKEAEITRLESENEIKQSELQFRKRERNWALAGVILLLGVSVSMYLLLATVKKQKSELAQQNEELGRLNRMLNKLFGIISHDLRNATAAYQSSAKIIGYHLQKGQPEKLLPLAPEIDKSARQLSAMLENLLNWSAIQIKGIQPEKEIIGVKKALDEVVSMFEETAKSKNNRITVEAGNEQVWCDTESLQLILRNLIGNAVKFTAGGVIKISASATGDLTTISIADTGSGMDISVVENLKNAMMPESKRGTAGEKGTGLGLAMVYEHISKNAGTLDVESTPGQGTVIKFNLPAKPI